MVGLTARASGLDRLVLSSRDGDLAAIHVGIQQSETRAALLAIQKRLTVCQLATAERVHPPWAGLLTPRAPVQPGAGHSL